MRMKSELLSTLVSKRTSSDASLTTGVTDDQSCTVHGYERNGSQRPVYYKDVTKAVET